MQTLRANRIPVALPDIPQKQTMGHAPLSEGLFGRGIVRNNHAFRVARSFAEVDKDNLTRILEASFVGKRVAPGFFERPVDSIFVDVNGQGVAIVMQLAGVGPYLDKIAVTPQAQGTGLAKTIMGHLRDEYGQIAWRATTQNPANGWYRRVSDAVVEAPHWNVYGWGHTPSEMEEVAKVVARLPPTMLVQQ